MTSLQKLGYPPDTRLLIIHADDAGLAHSENRATMQCLEYGMVNSCSIMVPCPWFYEMAVFLKNNARFDYGIHLTLTCEWEHYRFGPVLPASEVPGLTDGNGHFYKKREDLAKNASPEEVRRELQAQIEKALAFGLKPTHLDSHMYSVGAHPAFLKVYRELGRQYNLPVLINRQMMELAGMDAGANMEDGDFIVDHTYVGAFPYFEAGKLGDYYSGILENLDAGLNLILIHPAFDDAEMKGISVHHPNFGAAWRQVDFDFFTTDANRLKLREYGIEMITWNNIKNSIM